MAGHCRFSPTCSTYAEEAIQQHGMLKGSYLASKRILRCHPWGAAVVLTLCQNLSLGFSSGKMTMQWARNLILVGLAIVSYLMILAWQQDYGNTSTHSTTHQIVPSINSVEA
jgi:hypothetical protein